MSSRKNRRRRGSARDKDSLAEQYFGGGGTTDHKTIQLCSQVEEAIAMALVSSSDPIMRDLYVVAVEPLRGAARLRVLVATENQEDPDLHEITEKLDRARGYFRAEVANAIHRKRVPGLELSVIPREDDDGEA